MATSYYMKIKTGVSNDSYTYYKVNDAYFRQKIINLNDTSFADVELSYFNEDILSGEYAKFLSKVFPDLDIESIIINEEYFNKFIKQNIEQTYYEQLETLIFNSRVHWLCIIYLYYRGEMTMSDIIEYINVSKFESRIQILLSHLQDTEEDETVQDMAKVLSELKHGLYNLNSTTLKNKISNPTSSRKKLSHWYMNSNLSDLANNSIVCSTLDRVCTNNNDTSKYDYKNYGSVTSNYPNYVVYILAFMDQNYYKNGNPPSHELSITFWNSCYTTYTCSSRTNWSSYAETWEISENHKTNFLSPKESTKTLQYTKYFQTSNDTKYNFKLSMKVKECAQSYMDYSRTIDIRSAMRFLFARYSVDLAFKKIYMPNFFYNSSGDTEYDGMKLRYAESFMWSGSDKTASTSDNFGIFNKNLQFPNIGYQLYNYSMNADLVITKNTISKLSNLKAYTTALSNETWYLNCLSSFSDIVAVSCLYRMLSNGNVSYLGSTKVNDVIKTCPYNVFKYKGGTLFKEPINIKSSYPIIIDCLDHMPSSQTEAYSDLGSDNFSVGFAGSTVKMSHKRYLINDGSTPIKVFLDVSIIENNVKTYLDAAWKDLLAAKGSDYFTRNGILENTNLAEFKSTIVGFIKTAKTDFINSFTGSYDNYENPLTAIPNVGITMYYMITCDVFDSLIVYLNDDSVNAVTSGTDLPLYISVDTIKIYRFMLVCLSYYDYLNGATSNLNTLYNQIKSRFEKLTSAFYSGSTDFKSKLNTSWDSPKVKNWK